MTLQQTLQANSARTKELFDKLAETSDQAVKTRENLFTELARELRLHAEIEQKHLLPALRGNDKTKELVPEAARTNKELREKVDELEALPKGEAEFRERLGELRKLYQQQQREERQELVPAVRQKLGEEKAESVASRIEATRERAEDEQRAEAEAKRAVAKREAEARQAAQAGKDAAVAVTEAAKANARELGRSAAEAVDTGKHKAAEAVEATKHKASELRDAVQDASGKAAAEARGAAERVRNEARRVRDEAAATVAAYRATARERGADVQALGSALRNFGKAGTELRAVVVDSLKRSGRDSLELGKQILRDPRRFGKAQRAYAAAATRNLLESTDQALLIVRSASTSAHQPIADRLRAVA